MKKFDKHFSARCFDLTVIDLYDKPIYPYHCHNGDKNAFEIRPCRLFDYLAVEYNFRNYRSEEAPAHRVQRTLVITIMNCETKKLIAYEERQISLNAGMHRFRAAVLVLIPSIDYGFPKGWHILEMKNLRTGFVYDTTYINFVQ